nr:kinetochore-associated protein 1-like [Lytechinus pictus]
MTGSSAGDLFKQLLNLTQIATASCNPELLADCFDLSTKIRSLKDLCDQCESGDYGISVQIGAAETKKDPYEEYTLETFFKEDSLVLSSRDIIPVAAEFALSCQPTIRPRDALPYQQARVSGSPVFVKDPQKGDNEGAVQSGYIGQVASSTKYLCQQLKEHNQCCLAFHYVMELLATSLVHLSVNSSNQALQDEATVASFERALKELSEVDTAAKQNIGNLSSILLNKIFSCRAVDTFLALCYLIIQPSKELVKKLVYNAGQNYKKILAIAQVGYEMAKMNQDLKVQVVFQDLATSALWGDRLLKIKKLYIAPAINEFYAKKQEELFEMYRGRDVVLSRDGRADSPGYSASMMTYSFCNEEKKILHTTTVLVQEAGGKSPNMERIGFERGLDYVKSKINVTCVVTDAHPQIAALMKRTKNMSQSNINGIYGTGART